MAHYDFTSSLSPLDFELLSKDLLEVELGIKLENFSEGRDKGIDLRYALAKSSEKLIVQCKRYANFSNLKFELKNKELPKIIKLKPNRYILTISTPISPQQADELKSILAPFVQSTGDIYGKERLNSLLTKHPEVERRHIKLWVGSTGVLDSIINAGTHVVSREEVERTIDAAKIYVRNDSFDEALTILKQHRVCIISGLPGIGKTTLARILLLYFYKKQFDVVRIESDITEARAVSYHNRPRFYYYDDFLGQTAQADKLNKNEDQKLLDFMVSVRDSKDSVFVLTTREYILNQAKLHYEKLARAKFDHRTCIIDLSKYSRRIRAQILYNHLHFSKLPRAHLESLVAKRGYAQIVDHKNYNPRLIEYLTDLAWVGKSSSVEYLPLFLRNLDNPVEIWGYAFRQQLSDRARHLLFVLTTMPTESRMEDFEEVFSVFHNAQCKRFNIANRVTDFKNALKELDGTFVATRKIQGSVLVLFQNPSIRDFMQNLLLEGEMLSEVIISLVFFEQGQWFVETMNDKKSKLPLKELLRHVPKILNALQRLIETKSCSFSVYGEQPNLHISPKIVNPAARLTTVALAISIQKKQDNGKWMTIKISELTSKLTARELSPMSCVALITILKKLGYLTSNEGNRLASALKASAMNDPSDIEDFETLAKMIKILPHFFVESELKIVRKTYSGFADQYASECDLGNPAEIRAEASRIGSVGDFLQVDTNDAQASLIESADKIEEGEEEPDWDRDDDLRGSGDSADCSDAELDSMFGTLES